MHIIARARRVCLRLHTFGRQRLRTSDYKKQKSKLELTLSAGKAGPRRGAAVRVMGTGQSRTSAVERAFAFVQTRIQTNFRWDDLFSTLNDPDKITVEWIHENRQIVCIQMEALAKTLRVDQTLLEMPQASGRKQSPSSFCCTSTNIYVSNTATCRSGPISTRQHSQSAK